MKSMKVFALTVGMLVSGTSAAIVLGGSNLPLYGYPEHDCEVPYSKPTRPYSDDEWVIRNYNNEVDRYNDELREFRRCALDNVENANNDIERIHESVEDVLREAKSM